MFIICRWPSLHVHSFVVLLQVELVVTIEHCRSSLHVSFSRRSLTKTSECINFVNPWLQRKFAEFFEENLLKDYNSKLYVYSNLTWVNYSICVVLCSSFYSVRESENIKHCAGYINQIVIKWKIKHALRYLLIKVKQKRGNVF